MPNPFDATPTYRGYRLQALYTLWRIFCDTDSNDLIYRPEGKEDLAIYANQQNQCEIVQVKAHSKDLSLSSFNPDKPDSFFYQINSELEKNPGIEVIIASFGPIGPQLKKGIEIAGRERDNLVNKLTSYGYLNKAQARTVFERIKITPVTESDLNSELKTKFDDSMTGIDPEPSFEILHSWLVKCAEHKTKITRQDVKTKIDQVGKFLAQRAAHHKEWFTSIVPIEDHPIDETRIAQLSKQFYEGTFTQYDHILANLDVVRWAKLDKIQSGFKNNNVVILHGASGQGKTTLAFRYLKENFPNKARYHVLVVENRQHALSMARALDGYAAELDIPMLIYIDVTANDSEWPELVKQLAKNQNIRVLVTIREEDFHRANVSRSDFPFAEIELGLEKDEAQEIFSTLIDQKLPAQILDFDDAWQKFDAQGPLMEFIYLVTQGRALHDRLAQQIQRLKDDCRLGNLHPSELELLRLVSVAFAGNARLKVQPITSHLALAMPAATLEYFSNEYLLRISDEGTLVSGLHPIRSQVLAQLLTNPTFDPLSKVTANCLPFIFEEDIEIFLLHHFLHHPEVTRDLLTALDSFVPENWSAIGGVVRALIWLGIYEYVNENRALMDEIYADAGRGWYLIIDWDLANISDNLPTMIWQLGFVKSERKQQIQAFKARQTDKAKVFKHVKTWLASRQMEPTLPVNESNWKALAEVVFWIGYLQIKSPLLKGLANIDLDEAIENTPLEILSNLSLALYTALSEQFEEWFTKNEAQINLRFREETKTMTLDEDGEKMNIHFVVDYDKRLHNLDGEHDDEDNIITHLNEESVQRLTILRKLYPHREFYASQGYGHQFLLNILPNDPTLKTGIPKSKLPPLWLTSVNSTFRGLGEYPYRPETWDDYVQEIIILRESVLQNLEQMQQCIEKYFRQTKPLNICGDLMNETIWHLCYQRVQKPPMVPKCIIDKWGFTDESTTDNAREQIEKEERFGIALRPYAKLLNAFQEFTQTLLNFLEQSKHVMGANPLLGRFVKNEQQKKKVLELIQQKGLNPDLAEDSIRNLKENLKSLHSFQNFFRKLLANRIDSQVLKDLEYREQKLFPGLYHLWYFFALHPQRTIPNAKKECRQKFRQVQQKMKTQLRRRFKQLATENLTIDLLPNLQPDKNDLTLWIKIDGTDAIEVFNLVESLTSVIREVLQKAENLGIKIFALENEWSVVAILPLVNSKRFVSAGWRFNIPVLLNKPELKWWQYALQPIPEEVWQAFKIEKQESSKMELGNELFQRTKDIAAKVWHLQSLNTIPDMDEWATDWVQKYVTSICIRITDEFTLVFQVGEKILDWINTHSEEEFQQHPQLVLMTEALKGWHENIVPENKKDDVVEMNLGEMSEWGKRLENAVRLGMVVWLGFEMRLFLVGPSITTVNKELKV